MEIKRIISIFTPFQFKYISSYLGDDFDKNGNLILVSDIIYTSDIKHSQVLPFEVDTVSRKLMSEKKLSSLLEIRKNFKNKYEEYKQWDIKLDSEVTIYTPLDNNPYTQLLILWLQKNTKKLNVIGYDDGVSHYLYDKPKDKVIQTTTKWFFTLLTGFPVEKIRRYGTSRFVDKLILRHPEFIDHNYIQKVKIEKHTLPVSELEQNTSFGSKKVLFFTFPFEQLPYRNKSEIVPVINELIDFFIDKGYDVTIKKHPREFNDYSQFSDKINFLDKSLDSHNLNYYDYDYIVQFNSAMIFDLLFQSYPKERIINVSFMNEVPSPVFKYSNFFIYNSIDLQKIIIDDFKN